MPAICYPCNRTFSSRDALQRHLTTSAQVHPSCQSCNRRFTSQTAFESHMTAKHVPSFDCGVCSRSFHAVFALEDHFRGSMKHPNCLICGKGVFDNAALDEHMKVDHGPSGEGSQGEGTTTLTAAGQVLLDTVYDATPTASQFAGFASMGPGFPSHRRASTTSRRASVASRRPPSRVSLAITESSDSDSVNDRTVVQATPISATPSTATLVPVSIQVTSPWDDSPLASPILPTQSVPDLIAPSSAMAMPSLLRSQTSDSTSVLAIEPSPISRLPSWNEQQFPSLQATQLTPNLPTPSNRIEHEWVSPENIQKPTSIQKGPKVAPSVSLLSLPNRRLMEPTPRKSSISGFDLADEADITSAMLVSPRGANGSEHQAPPGVSSSLAMAAMSMDMGDIASPSSGDLGMGMMQSPRPPYARRPFATTLSTISSSSSSSSLSSGDWTNRVRFDNQNLMISNDKEEEEIEEDDIDFDLTSISHSFTNLNGGNKGDYRSLNESRHGSLTGSPAKSSHYAHSLGLVPGMKSKPIPARLQLGTNTNHTHTHSLPITVNHARVAVNGSSSHSPSPAPVHRQTLRTQMHDLSNYSMISPISSADSSDSSTDEKAQVSPETHPLHCRICKAERAVDIAATMCGHVFCYRCITDYVIAQPRCAVCAAPTLLYSIFRLDLSS